MTGGAERGHGYRHSPHNTHVPALEPPIKDVNIVLLMSLAPHLGKIFLQISQKIVTMPNLTAKIY